MSENGNNKLNQIDVEAFFGRVEKESVRDAQFNLTNRARVLLLFWQELNFMLQKAKEGYRLAVKWNDEELKKKYIEEARPSVTKIFDIESDLKQVLAELKGVNFLTEKELDILPEWVRQILSVKIN